MSGELQECGCFDGPYCADLPHTLVSVRCRKHEQVPPLARHSLMWLDEKGEPYAVKPVAGKLKYSAIRRDV